MRFYYMVLHRKLTALTTLLIFVTSASAFANSSQAREQTTPILDIIQEDDFIAMPIDVDITFDKAIVVDRETPDAFDEEYITQINYDILGEFDADFGLIKTRNTSERYRVKSGALPRGRYFKPDNSKLGAGISRKF